MVHVLDKKEKERHVIPIENLNKEPATINIIRRKLNLGNTPKCKLNHVQCSIWKSRTCLSWLLSIYNKLKENKDHVNDNWYHAVQNIIIKDDYPRNLTGHCFEIQKRMDDYRNTATTPSEYPLSSGIYYDGYLHLP